MNIIEKGTRQRIEFLDKIKRKAGRRWKWMAGIGLLLFLSLIIGVYFAFFPPLSFSFHDFFFIGLFLLAVGYCLFRLQRM